MDQCTHCTLRGNLKECEAGDCSQHESWYVSALQEKVNTLTAELKEVRELIKGSRMNHGLCSQEGSCTTCYSRKELGKIGDKLLATKE